MNQINQPPVSSPDFGLDFNYSVWTAGTVVDLVNVPWNNDYRDVVKFASRNSLDAYINGIVGSGVKITKLSYAKPNQPISINLPINRVINFNYLRASNPIQPIPGEDVKKNYYYFITDVRYVAPNTTEIVVQLDVFQTFIYDVKFGNCYINRGHIGIANERNFDSYGLDYLTVPEGLDIGNEYVSNPAATGTAYPFSKSTEYTMFESPFESSIIAFSSVDLLADGGTSTAPKLNSARGSMVQGLPSGASMYAWKDVGAFKAWLGTMANKPWVTQGIMSITVTPPLERYSQNINWPATSIPILIDTESLTNKVYELKLGHVSEKDFRKVARSLIPKRYQHLNKFLTYPYMLIEFTNYTGNSVVLKPELTYAMTVEERIGIVPPDMRVSFVPFNYNNEGYNVALWLKNFPKMPIVNNMAISYLASNANSIPYQYTSADWSQQRALGSNQAAYDNVTSGMNLANELTQIGVNADVSTTSNTNDYLNRQAGIGLFGNLANTAGAAASANPGGIIGGLTQSITGIASTMNSTNSNNMQLAVRNATANASNQASVGNTGFVRDTNKNLSDWAARGDYENTIAGINAKVQDAAMIQPSTSGAFGGETFMVVNNKAKIQMKVKQLNNAIYRSIGEYWLRYGYAVQQFARIPASLMAMTKFTYWKLSETYLIAGPMPESHKQTIRGIFEKGVTVWVNPNDIGNVDLADNKPIDGIYL